MKRSNLQGDKNLNKSLRKKSAEIFKKIISLSIDGFWLVDKNGKILDANNAYCNMIGYSRDELLNGMTITDIEVNQTQAEVDQNLKIIIEEGGVSFESRHRRKDGGIIDVEVSASYFEDSGDKFFAFIRDVSEKQLTKQKIHESEQRYRQLVEHSPNAIVIHQDGKVVFANSVAFEKIKDEKHDQLIGKDITEIIHPQHLKAAISRIKKILSGQEVEETVEYLLKRFDGNFFCAEISSALVKYNGKDAIQLIARDISERKEVEEKLIENDLLLKNLSNQVPGVIYQYQYFPDGRSCFPFATEHIHSVYEVTPGEVKEDASKVFERLHPEDFKNVEHSIMESFEKLTVWSLEYRVILPRKGLRWLYGKAVPTKQDDGSVIWYGYIHDITERKLAEQKLKESEERYQNFIKQSFDGIYRIEIDPPIDTSLSIQSQIKQLYEHSILVECNNAFAEMYGTNNIKDILGWSFAELHGGSDNPTNIEVQTRFIQNGYRIENEETQEKKLDGKLIWILNNSFGVIENNKLIRIWGSQKDITELKEKDKLLQNVNNSIPGLVLRYQIFPDHSEKLIYISKGVEDLFEIPREEAMKNVNLMWERIHPDDFDEFYNSVIESAENCAPWYHEGRLLLPDGRIKWVQANGTPVKQTDESVIFDTVQIDITDKRNSELRVIESEKRFKTLADTAPVLIWMSDTTNKCTYFNKVWLDFTGRSFEEEIGNGWSEGVHPDDLKNVLTTYTESFNRRDSFEMQYRLRTKDGSYRWVFNKGVPRFSDEGEFIGYIGSCIDIQERRLSELALLESEANLKLQSHILTNMAEGACLVKVENGEILYTNSSFDKMFGYEPGELFGKHTSILNAPTDKSPEDVYNSIAAELIRNKTWRGEVCNTKKDGTYFWTYANVSTFKHPAHGEVWICAQSDITDRKKTERLVLGEKKRLELLHSLHTETENLTDDQLYQLVINKAVELTDSKIGFFHLVADDQNTLKLTTWSYGTEQFCNAVFDDHYPVEQAGFWADSIKNKEAVVCNDYLNSDLKKGLPEGHNPVFRFISVPVIGNGKVNFVFGVGNKENDYTETEVLHLKIVAEEFQKLWDNRKYQRELEENEEKFEKAFLTSPDAIAITRISDGCYIDVNDSFERILGYEREEMIGNSSLNMNIWKHEKERQRLVDGLKEKGFVENLEAEYLTKDGKTIYGLMSARIIKFAGEDVILSITRDITDRKIMEDSLNESEQKHRKLVSNISDVIVVIDKEGKINYKSSNIEEHFGWQPEDLIGKDALFTVHANDKPLVFEELKKLISENNYQSNLEFLYRCKDGSFKPVELTAVSLINDPVINGIIANYRDISERKEAERILIDTQRLGAIGEMSSAVAHDFNNSLQSIFGNIDLALINTEKSHPARNYLEVIKTSTTDAAARVKLLQRFAGKSKSDTDFENVQINTLINDVLVQTRPIWKDNAEKNGKLIEIEKNLECDSNVFANPGELRSVLYNIIKNSVEAITNSGTIRIESFDIDKNVYITVQDDGIGMDEKTQSRVFQPFFTTKGFESGRGMGMSCAYSIIKEHGGSIDILESAPGLGTVTRIMLPISNGKKSITTIEDEVTTDVNKSAKILWVDDDEMIRDVAIDMLEVLGHSGKIASSGDQALKILAEEKFDLVVTDIGMPGMSGWELTAEINRVYDKQIKVAVLTGWGDSIEEEKKKEFGVEFVVTKPVTLEKLSKLINRILS